MSKLGFFWLHRNYEEFPEMTAPYGADRLQWFNDIVIKKIDQGTQI